MKKSLFILVSAFIILNISNANALATEPVVKIEIPASSVNSIDVNYEKKEPSVTEKAIDATKEATDKTVKATKKATKKTVEATKDFTDKTVKATKKATKKTVEATKDFTGKTVEGTKDFFEDLNPNKPVTVENLEYEASLKTLKNEKKELKAAYNSRIKDTKAKIKATEKSTIISDVQKRNQIHQLNKQVAELEHQKELAITKYDSKITTLKNNNKK